MTTNAESLWLFALASKCNSTFTPLNTSILAFLVLLSWLILNLIFWAHPGGPAWGKHKHYNNNSNKNPSNVIPGPKGLPIIGSLPLTTGLAHRKLSAAAESHQAKRLMAFSMGESRAIITCHPDIAKEILNSSAFLDRPVKESAYALMFNRSIGFAPYGAYWTVLRKIAAAHMFCPKQMKATELQRVEIAKQVVEAVNSSDNCGGGVRVRKLLKRASLCNMMCAVFGRRYDVVGMGDCRVEEMEELSDLVEQGYELLGEVNWGDHLSFLKEFDLQRVRFRCDGIVPRVNRFVGRIVEERRTGGGEGEGSFVDVLMSLQGDDRLSDSDMIAVLWEMIFRGTDTVAVLIEWILARLVMHPDVQSKVHHELDRVVGRSRAVIESDLSNLVYLTAVVKEVLRIHPPGPLLAWSRLSIRDSNVDGHHVPAGTTAMVNMWAIMRDPEVWADPLKFNPERFLSHDPNMEFSVLGSDLRIAPFGSGRRSCPGKMMGMTTVNLWVATLLHEFEFAPSAHQAVDLSEVLKLSCEMVNPLTVKAQPRRCGVSSPKC